MSEVKRYKPVINDKPYKPYAYCEQNDEGIYVRIDDYAELKAQRDALSAENAAIRASIPSERFIDIMNDSMDDVSLAEDIGYNTAVKEMIRDTKTPATAAYLNSVRAEGVDYVAEAIGAKCAELKVGSKDWKALKSIVFTLVDFSARLRAGESSPTPPQ